MRSFTAGARVMGAALVVAVVAGLVIASSAMAAPEFGFSKFTSRTCEDAECKTLFTQAAGHPPFGVTEFKMNTLNPGATGKEVPAGLVKNLRIDVPAGLTTNPEAVPKCTMTEFGKEAPPGSGIFPPSTCAENTKLGTDKVVVVAEPAPGVFADVELKGIVYNLERPPGAPSEFGAALELGPLGLPGAFAHTLLEGGVSWHSEVGLAKAPIPTSGDYHEFFKINNISNMPPLLESTLAFNGTAGSGTTRFLTLPSSCSKAQVSNIEGESYEGQFGGAMFPLSGAMEMKATGCENVEFKPEIKVEPSTTQSDLPDGARIRIIAPPGSETISSSSLSEARIEMPEGMTLNPAAASGLEACTDAQFGKGTGGASTCPMGSKIGTVVIQTPTLPENALTGNVYVGAPVSGSSPSSGEEYRIFIDAESPLYGVTVRLVGKVMANESTGRLLTIVPENPQAPFSEFILTLSNGNHTPLANPLTCGPSATTASLQPFTGAAAADPFSSFAVDANGSGGACASPLPFALGQSTSALPTSGGSTTSFTLGLSRADGQQYLKRVSATLPAGLVAKIPSVPLCGEPLAREGKCPAASEIGRVSTSIGSGPAPYALSGSVYLTGPFDGAPFGLSIVVPAEHVGPYNYGRIVTQAGISIDPYTARVTVAGDVPTIVGGVPLRLKALTIAITHGNFMLNPTNCGALSTNTTLTSTAGATDTIVTRFQATGCSSLAFKPTFSYSTNAFTTKRFGASLNVKVAQSAGEANIKSVKVTLPMKLPSRVSTLKLACLEKTFAANPASCPAGAVVGTVKITTPTLPGRLTGSAYFVSHGGAAFPDLDLVVKGDGVTVILVGNTNISKQITHTTFAALPDVPFSSFEMNLPTGEKSALAANGNFCKGKMYMPTTVVAQSGKKIDEKVQIQVVECPVRVVGHGVQGKSATITAAVSSAGRLSTSGRDLVVVHKRIGKAVGNAKIAVRLSRLGQRILASKRQIDVRVRVGFKPSTGAKRESKAYVKLVFRG